MLSTQKAADPPATAGGTDLAQVPSLIFQSAILNLSKATPLRVELEVYSRVLTGQLIRIRKGDRL